MRVPVLSDWEVVGPEGEYYGRFKTKPDLSKGFPPYVRLVEARDEWRMDLGAFFLSHHLPGHRVIIEPVSPFGVTIQGNKRQREEVIRRELTSPEAPPLTAPQIRRTMRSLF